MLGGEEIFEKISPGAPISAGESVRESRKALPKGPGGEKEARVLSYLSSIETEAEKSKFVQVYEAYQGLMFHTAFRLLRQPEDAEDAVHEAFLYLAKNIGKISEAVSPKTKAYVVLIVESRAIDQLRRRQRRPTVPLEDWRGIETPSQGGRLPGGVYAPAAGGGAAGAVAQVLPRLRAQGDRPHAGPLLRRRGPAAPEGEGPPPGAL